MRLREKGKADGEPVHMGWDEGQAALAAGTHVSAEGTEAKKLEADDETAKRVEDDGLDKLTRDELATMATERGVKVDANAGKADLINALRAAK